jgi:hypothetical protein
MGKESKDLRKGKFRAKKYKDGMKVRLLRRRPKEGQTNGW